MLKHQRGRDFIESHFYLGFSQQNQKEVSPKTQRHNPDWSKTEGMGDMTFKGMMSVRDSEQSRNLISRTLKEEREDYNPVSVYNQKLSTFARQEQSR